MTYDVRQFRRSVWLLMLLGVSGFAVAAESWLFLFLGAAAIIGNAWTTRAGRFKPLPRPLANLVTLAALAYVIRQVGGTATPVMIVGRFLLFLQLVKLWEQRGNRDWTQILVLSFLLMVAASMNTASLWFCVILVVYLFLLLYCCLLFHLKVEAEAATKAMPTETPQPTPQSLRNDQRFLGRSMRRLTAVVSAVGVVFAVGVFIAFPRWNVGMLGPRFSVDNPLTGFSDHVSFQSLAKITQNHERIAFVKVLHNGELVQGTQTLLLRGLTLNDYSAQGQHEWARYPMEGRHVSTEVYTPTRPLEVGGEGSDVWRQEMILWPTHTTALFALPGIRQLTPHSKLHIRYIAADGTVRVFPPPADRIEYDVVSTNVPEDDQTWSSHDWAYIQSHFSRVYAFARLPEVCGVDAQRRNLADLRLAQRGDISPLDPIIASNIETYLRTHFTYTLDLTDEQQVKDKDPLEQFLYTWKRGHCEYFAGAMTLMCQSLGMKARMVIGFKCPPENYNDFAQSYAVYESDAHAWVEVQTPKGWVSYDPTSSRTDEQQKTTLVARIRQLMEYGELKYANAVIAYDAETRQSVIGMLETTAGSSGTRVLASLGEAEDWMASHSLRAISFALALLTIASMSFVGRVVWDRRRLLHRARRIGIQSLPEDEQLKLARQLGFYDDLIRLLEERRIVRPPQLTPLEFSRSLAYLPAGVYDTILRLTRLFYHIRYGGAGLTQPRQRRLQNVLARLGRELE